MLFYLDNWMSADPNATSRWHARPDTARPRAGARRPRLPDAAAGTTAERGLNENYARELLELHTLGVDGGYTQQDVVEVARAFTGWTIGRPADAGFRFARGDARSRREEGAWPDDSRPAAASRTASACSTSWRAHPSTARHIAFKLAQRFVSDTPPQALVDRAAQTFHDDRTAICARSCARS